MEKISVRPYTEADDAHAVTLEAACEQGGSLAVRFRRSSFAARSAAYEESDIFCGWIGDRLAGTVAAARKNVMLRGQPRRVTYFYDLRVHPEFRGRGLAHALIRTAMKECAANADCIYTLVAGQNVPMLRILESHYRDAREVVIPLTYTCLPVYQHRNAQPVMQADPDRVRARHLRATHRTFQPTTWPERMAGHVDSVKVDGAGCSIWTNEDLLAEEVVRLPVYLRALSAARPILKPLLQVPEVPRPGEVIRSWFLYDIYADSKAAFMLLLDAVNDLAYQRDRVVLYLLLQNDDPMLSWTRSAQRITFTFPYQFIARGSCVPAGEHRLYLDIRDV